MAVTDPVIAEEYVQAWDVTVRPGELGHWRARVGALAAGWGAAPGAVHVAQLGVTELLSNADRHAGCAGQGVRCRLEVRKVGVLLRVQVRDPSPVLPVVREPSWECESGRGLWVLRGVVRSLGWYRLPCGAGEGGGKIVWLWCDLAPYGTGESR